MNANSRWVVVSLILLAVACNSAAQQKVPFPRQDVVVTRPDFTRIYFLREDTTVLQRSTLRVLESDKEMGSLTTGTYLCWERPAGRTLGRVFYEALDPSRGKLEGLIDMNCEAGRAYYYNVTVSKDNGTPVVRQVDETEGRALVAKRSPAGQ